MSQTKAEELIGLTEKLAALVEQDVATLKARRPAALTQNDDSRATLLAAYAKATADFKNPTAITALPAPAQKRLKIATERLHKALKEQNRLLARFRHVTEGLVKAIADAVAARQTPATYGKSGAYAKTPAVATRATSMTLNKAV